MSQTYISKWILHPSPQESPAHLEENHVELEYCTVLLSAQICVLFCDLHIQTCLLKMIFRTKETRQQKKINQIHIQIKLKFSRVPTPIEKTEKYEKRQLAGSSSWWSEFMNQNSNSMGILCEQGEEGRQATAEHQEGQGTCKCLPWGDDLARANNLWSIQGY